MSEQITLWAVYDGKMHRIEAIKTAAQYRLKRAPLAFGCMTRLRIDQAGRPRQFGGAYCERREEALGAYRANLSEQISRHAKETAELSRLYAADVPDAQEPI